jgi:hypothetical protein
MTIFTAMIISGFSLKLDVSSSTAPKVNLTNFRIIFIRPLANIFVAIASIGGIP